MAAAPQLLDARGVANGCYQASNSLAYSVPAGANLLLLRLENGDGVQPSAVSYNGAALTLLMSNPDFSGGLIQTWLLGSPPAGSHTLSIQYGASNCSWNVAVEAYGGVDPVQPIGATAFTQSTSDCPPTSFSDSLTAQQGDSLLSDFLAVDVLPPSMTLGPGQTSFNFSTGCCDNIYGDYKVVASAGAASLGYTFSQCKRYDSQLVELRAACPPSGPAQVAARDRSGAPLKTEAPSLEAYPNPSQGTAHAAYRVTESGPVLLACYGLDGSVFRRWGLGDLQAGSSGQAKLDLGGLAPGIYLLVLEQDTGGGFQSQASFKLALLR